MINVVRNEMGVSDLVPRSRPVWSACFRSRSVQTLDPPMYTGLASDGRLTGFFMGWIRRGGMESPARRPRRDGSPAGEPVHALNAGLIGLGSLLFVNGAGISLVSVFVPFAVNTVLVSVFVTALFVLSVVWYLRSDGIDLASRVRQSRGSHTPRRGF